MDGVIIVNPKIIFAKKRRGSVFVFVLIIFLTLSIFATSVIYVFNANLKQAKHQQDSLEAYYLAYSGVEMGYAALVANTNERLNKLVANTVSEYTETEIDFGNGKIDILAKVTNDTNFDGWIKVTGKGKLNKNGLEFVRSMYFDPANPIDIVWKSN
ncbi:MAG: hypothetical protein RBR71_00655 [Gudongella sp.]|nr:hypothetical protein [Gudongella sp.]